jgi:hypothetical protein
MDYTENGKECKESGIRGCRKTRIKKTMLQKGIGSQRSLLKNHVLTSIIVFLKV